MDHYIVTVHDTTYDIDVDDVGDSHFSVTVNGDTIDVTLQQQKAQQEAATATKPVISQGSGEPRATRSSTTTSPAASSAPASSSGGAHQMTAPMPGVIADVRATVGASVDKGDQVKYGQPLIQFKEA